MRNEMSEVIDKLGEANATLARLSVLHKQLENILDDLHNGDKAACDELSDLKKNTNATSEATKANLKNTISESVTRYNKRLVKANYGVFNLNTFQLNPNSDLDKDFDEKLEKFIGALESEKNLFNISKSPLFTESGSFNRKNTLLLVSSEINTALSRIKTSINERKRAYNQKRFRLDSTAKLEPSLNSKRYLVEVVSAKKDDQTQAEWLAALRDKPTFKQYHEERKAYHSKHSNAEKADATRLANNDLFIAIADSYLKNRDSCYFREIFSENVEMAKKLIRLGERVKEKETLDIFEASFVVKAIGDELKRHRRVYIGIQLKEKKSKTTALMVSQWASSVALLSAVGQACLSAYAVAGALGYTTASGGLMSYLSAHPAATAAVIAVFASVLLTNMIMYNTFVKSLFGLFAKGRMLKNKDGTQKTDAEKRALWIGLSVSVMTALGGAALAFNGCQSMFSGVFSVSPSAIPVVAISLVIAAITFFALTSFNFQFFYAVLGDLEAYKKQMNRMFFKGRSKAGKGIVLALCALMTVLYTIGSFMVSVASIKTLLEGLSVKKTAASGFAYSLTIVTSCYFLVAGFGSNRGLLAMFRAKLNELSAFAKKAGAGHVAGNVLARFLRIPLELIFFVASVVLVLARMGVAAVKTVMNLVFSIVGVLAGLGSAIAGKSFKQGFNAVATVPERSMTYLHKKSGAWWDMAFMYCVKRGGMLGVLLNAGSQAALRKTNMNEIRMAVTAPTMLVSAGLSSSTNAGAMAYTTKAYCDAKAGERDLDASQKELAPNTSKSSFKPSFSSGFSSGLWSDFLSSSKESGMSNKAG